MTAQKTLGAFYTDAPVAHYLVEWALRQPTDCLPDPSCAGGAFDSGKLPGGGPASIFGGERGNAGRSH
jgi:hypothetical protein